MIHDIACRPADGKRQGLYDFLRKKRAEKEGYRIIEIGGALNPFNCSFLSAIVDIKRPKHLPEHIVFHEGNVNNPEVWAPVEADVRRHGKFDFSICTHMLEDIANPGYACRKLSEVADRGFVAVPSKYKELSRFEIEAPAYRGYIHHRWILTMRDHTVMAFPKLSFLDFDPYFDSLTNDDLARLDEFSFWWKDRINLKIVNDDFLGPTPQAVVEYYKRGLTGDDLDVDIVRQWINGANRRPGPVVPDRFERPVDGNVRRWGACIGLFSSLARRTIEGSGTEFDLGKTLLSFALSIHAATILEFGRFKGVSTVFLAFALGLVDDGLRPSGASHGQGQETRNQRVSAKQVVCITSDPVVEAEGLLSKICLSDHVHFAQTVPDELKRQQATDLVVIDAGLDAACFSAIHADVASSLKPGGYVLFHDASSRRRTGTQNEDRIFLAAKKILANDAYGRICLDAGHLPTAIFQKDRASAISMPV
ncbi:MAG: class I SAM-dependent methyltransferase [Desulfobacterales bacterium]|nr:class I SAM-dependent methyltransferase [Desulfobacterales bacterium]